MVVGFVFVGVKGWCGAGLRLGCLGMLGLLFGF